MEIYATFGFILRLPKYNKRMVDALLIYNPAAGRISVRPFVGGVIHTLNDHGWRVEVAESLNGRHTTQLARVAAQENFRAVFAMGAGTWHSRLHLVAYPRLAPECAHAG